MCCPEEWKQSLQGRIKCEVSHSLVTHYYKAILFKAGWHVHKSQHIDQWNKKRKPRNKPTAVCSINLCK